MSRIRFLILATCVSMACYPAARATSIRAASRATGYTLVQEETSTNLPSNQQFSRVGYIAKRSDGAVSEGSYGNSDPAHVRELFVPAERLTVMISDISKTKSTLYSPPQEKTQAESGKPPLPECRDWVDPSAAYEGEGEYLGFPVFRHRNFNIEGQFTVESERWLAPALDCRAVEEVFLRRNSSGEVTTRFERRTVTAKVGEPDQSYFDRAASYLEVKPSELTQRISAVMYPNRPSSVPSCASALMSRLDKRYEDAKQYAPSK